MKVKRQVVISGKPFFDDCQPYIADSEDSDIRVYILNELEKFAGAEEVIITITSK